MQHLHQATLGSVRHSCTVGGFVVIVSDYSAGTRLPQHEHSNAYLSLVVRGGYWQTTGGRISECNRDLLLVHPEGECHSDRFAEHGGRCLDVHFNHTPEADPAIRRLLADHLQLRLNGTAWLQQRIERELAATDAAAKLALQSAILELIALTCRQADPQLRREPAWLAQVRERLHDDPFAVPTLQELATLAGVHPAHLARSFHKLHGVSVGDYLRRLRVERTCEVLARTRESIASIAVGAGFANQSHFARVFRHITGETPRAWRQRMQNRY